MKVITISEDNHGQIGIAANYYSAINFLIKENWLNEYLGVWINHHGFLIKEVFNDWEKEVYSWNDVEKFNDFFQDTFFLSEEEVYSIDY